MNQEQTEFLYDKAMQVYGIKAQLHQLAEECIELADEAMHTAKGTIGKENPVTAAQLFQEIVDVRIMCEQIERYFGEGENGYMKDMMQNFRLDKLERLKFRLEKIEPLMKRLEKP
ncbi:TPA: hypothetical protein DDW35_10405 [Candidatus Sumerlaeota bacterium]|jgi:hypothetical protein|nr:hypothetical protein [Candidatus Sumerlaeota bacterium]